MVTSMTFYLISRCAGPLTLSSFLTFPHLTPMGIAYSIYTEWFPPRSTFTVPEDIPDLSGKVMIVTGANTGTYQTCCVSQRSTGTINLSPGIGEETAKVRLLLPVAFVTEESH